MINRRSNFHCLYCNPYNVPTASSILKSIMFCAVSIHLAPFLFCTRNNEEETIASETIVNSGCVRASTEAVRTHTVADLLFLFIERSRPHLSGPGDIHVQLPCMATHSSHSLRARAPVARCRASALAAAEHTSLQLRSIVRSN